LRAEVAGTLAVLIGLSLALPARADGPTPNADLIRSAADEYDAARRAYGVKAFDEAAVHFENAFRDAPTAEALRNAIRSRREAKEDARAATLAALATVRYPNDPTTSAFANGVLESLGAQLYKVLLRCTPKCAIAVDGRAISLNDAPETVFYLDSGTHLVVVSWKGRGSKSQSLVARAGGHDDLALVAPPAPPPAPLPATVLVSHDAPARPKPLGRAVFFTGLGLTLAAAGATIVSGIEAENTPGTAAVRQECVGQGTSCAAYQKGLSAQLRTNVALGVTGGLALATAIVGVFFTQWSRYNSSNLLGSRVRPTIGLDARGGQLGVAGGF
jgi:hypothetical protein